MDSFRRMRGLLKTYGKDADETSLAILEDMTTGDVVFGEAVLSLLDDVSEGSGLTRDDVCNALLSSNGDEVRLEAKKVKWTESRAGEQLLKRAYNALSDPDLKAIVAKAEMRRHVSADQNGLFLKLCRWVRGFPLPLDPTEPGVPLMALGRCLHELQHPVPEQALRGFVDLMRVRIDTFEAEHANARAVLAYVERFLPKHLPVALWARLWAKEGFPVVELSHKVAAALMFTYGPSDVDAPWPAFLIKVPDGLLQDELGGDLRHVQFMRPPGEAVDWLRTEKIIPEKGDHYIQMARFLKDGERTQVGPATATDRGRLKRQEKLVANLSEGICMLMMAKDEITLQPYRPKPPSDRRRPPGMDPPEGTRYIIGKTVQVDLREQVREHVTGKTRTGGKLTKQSRVRSHRRWQACGPGRIGRKMIWIQSFWKGPLDGRALVRGYRLRDEGVTAPSGGSDNAGAGGAP